ncbi:MAG: PQQ-binding-like beta-propeller repeat protein, partial [Vicinamibacterales bacterium]
MDTNRRVVIAIAGLVGATLLAAAPAAQDWPQWRGPERDGVITAFNAPASWPEQLTEQWKVEVGQGYATPLLVGDRLYLYTRQKDDEVMSALDARTGKVIWRTSYPAPFTMNSSTARHGPGPKSTPTFASGRLFTLGMTGVVTAFDAATGKRLWQKAASPVQPLFHTAMSPVVDGNLVIVLVGGHDDGALTAFDVATGDAKWSWNGDGPAYGSPMVFDLGGTRQVVTFTQKNLVGVSLATGELLW